MSGLFRQPDRNNLLPGPVRRAVVREGVVPALDDSRHPMRNEVDPPGLNLLRRDRLPTSANIIYRRVLVFTGGNNAMPVE